MHLMTSLDKRSLICKRLQEDEYGLIPPAALDTQPPPLHVRLGLRAAGRLISTLWDVAYSSLSTNQRDLNLLMHVSKKNARGTLAF